MDLLEDKLQYSEDFEHEMFMDMLRSELTEREFICVRMIIIEGWTAEMVAKKLGVSKQAVNQCKLRALEKIKNLYL